MIKLAYWVCYIYVHVEMIFSLADQNQSHRVLRLNLKSKSKSMIKA